VPVSHIESPQNPTIKSVSKLRTHRGRRQQDRIIVDGLREIRRAIDSGIEIDSIFVPLGHESDWASATANVYTVSERAFSKIAFGHRKEVVAVSKTPPRSLDDLSIPPAARIAVLEGIEKPGNVGAVLRSADGAGMDAVLVVDPVIDLFNPNTIRASLGTIFSMQIATATFDKYADLANQHGLHHLLATCASDVIHYRDADFENGCAIVLGSEANGLSERWGNLRSTAITIPMMGISDSLNVASAATVLFYEAMKNSEKPE
jgi:TrmH family RNA methyltransferase